MNVALADPPGLNRQFVDLWRWLCRSLPGSDCRELPGLAVAWADLGLPTGNGIFLTSSLVDEADLAARLAGLGDYLKTRTQPPTLFLCEAWVPPTLDHAVAAGLGAIGLAPVRVSTAMVAASLTPPGPLPPGCAIKPLEGMAELGVLARINSAVYGLPDTYFEPYMAAPAMQDPAMFVARAIECDGIPVAVAAVTPMNDALHVAFVATLPAYRRRGLAQAAMHAALADAARTTGLSATTLHASEAGLSLYERMGYVACVRFIGYSYPSPAAGQE